MTFTMTACSRMSAVALMVSFLCLLSAVIGGDADTVDISIITSAPLTAPIQPNFIAFSIEVFGATWYTGRSPAPTRPSFINLIHQLQITSGTTTIFRIGGDSADTSVYVPNDVATPPSGITYNITKTDIVSLNAAMNAVNGKLTLGVNFRLPFNATLAAAHVAAIADTVGFDRIDAIEIGNEVDFYGSSRGGRPYNYSAYKEQWNDYVRQLYAAVPSLPSTRAFQGMSLGGAGWFGDVADFIASDEKYCTVIAVHGYGSTHCGGHVTSLAEMLSDGAARLGSIFPQLISSGAMKAAAAANIPVVLGEGNSISCHASVGNNTVEVSYTTALWGLHVAANAALTGLQRFHFHHGVAEDFRLRGYSSFVYLDLNSDVPTVLPLYYAMKLFAQFTSENAVFVNTTIATSNQQIKAFSTATKSEIRLLVLHKDLSATSSANVRFATDAALSSSSAECIRLTGASAALPFGVKLGGQTYDGSPDGFPRGDKVIEMPQSDAQGVFTIAVPPLSAIMCIMALKMTV